MGTIIAEFHGAKPGSIASNENARKRWCPYTDKKCIKKNGACSLRPSDGEPVIICRNRLYGDNFAIIRALAISGFENDAAQAISPAEASQRYQANKLSGHEVIVNGQGFGKELGIRAPSADESAKGTFKIDYVLSLVDSKLDPMSIIAAEVQTIDTTNSYGDMASIYYARAAKPGSIPDASEELTQEEAQKLISTNPDIAQLAGEVSQATSDDSDIEADQEEAYDDEDPEENQSTGAGFNWENVSKRILPQVIYKGHALRRERLARKGLFFILPRQVFEKILIRVGGKVLEYPQGLGTVTFLPFELGPVNADGLRQLIACKPITTSVEQIAFAFVSPQNLPPLGEYERLLTKRANSLRKNKTSTAKKQH